MIVTVSYSHIYIARHMGATCLPKTDHWRGRCPHLSSMCVHFVVLLVISMINWIHCWCLLVTNSLDQRLIIIGVIYIIYIYMCYIYNIYINIYMYIYSRAGTTPLSPASCHLNPWTLTRSKKECGEKTSYIWLLSITYWLFFILVGCPLVI